MGHVILGMPGQWAENNYEDSDHYTTKIGGVPDWPSKDFVLDSEMLLCRLCRASLCLVTQVYAPISFNELNIEERVIYVLACQMPKCSSNPSSWRTIRVQKRQHEIHSSDDCCPKQLQEGGFMSSDLTKSTSKCLEEDSCQVRYEHVEESSDDDMDLDQLAQALQEASASLASFSKKENVSAKAKQVRRISNSREIVTDTKIPVLPCFYIYPLEEPSTSLSGNIINSLSSISIKENHISTTENSDGEKWEGEQYEYDKALAASRTYLKFKKRMDLCPEQCFRYIFSGKPLLAADTLENPSACDTCGAMRHYEMQLMPPLLYYLQEAATGASRNLLEEWDWMTVIIYTCSNSCFQESRKGESSSNCWTVVEESNVIQY